MADLGAPDGRFPLRFCLAIDHLDWVRDEPTTAVARTLDLAKLADRAGFDSLWLNEDPDGWDAFAVLGAIAMQTERLRLGPGVTNPYHRHPNLIAASLATLDRLSAGRAFLGLGRGQPEWYERAFGLERGNPLRRLEETIRLVRQWSAPPYTATSEGEITVHDWRRSLPPLEPRPVYLAAVGPQALDLAGRLADGVLFNELATPEFLRWAIERVRSAATDADRDPSALAFFANPAITVTDDPEPFLKRKRGLIAVVHAMPGMERLLTTDRFDVEAIMGEVRESMRTEAILARGGSLHEIRTSGDIGRAKSAIPLGLVAHASAIGPLREVRAKVAELADIGVTHLFFDRRGLSRDRDELQALLRLLQPPTR